MTAVGTKKYKQKQRESAFAKTAKVTYHVMSKQHFDFRMVYKCPTKTVIQQNVHCGHSLWHDEFHEQGAVPKFRCEHRVLFVDHRGQVVDIHGPKSRPSTGASIFVPREESN